jgi:hypothetical protein
MKTTNKNISIALRATMLVTITALTSTFTLTQSASAKGFDFFEQVRDAVSSSQSSKTGSSDAAKLKLIISRGDAEINRRLQTLAHLNNDINASVHLSAANKVALTTQVNNTSNSLNTLKAKLDGDTTIAAARADAQSILTEYRVYALVVPKIHLIKMADDIQATDSKLSTVAGKLQTRINAAKTAGKDVSALEAKLTDMNAEIAAGQNIAANVETKVIVLQPSDYNSDHKILSVYSSQLKTARSDNQAAFNDAKSIINTLKTL